MTTADLRRPEQLLTSLPGKGSIKQAVSERWKYGVTYLANLPVTDKLTDRLTFAMTPSWTQSYSKYRDSQYGNVAEVDAAISSITTTMTNEGMLNPGRFASYDPAGASPVNAQNLGGYGLTQIALKPQTGYDTWSGGPASLKYAFATAVPVTLEVGYRYDDHVRQDSKFLNTLTVFTAANGGGAAVQAIQDNVFGQHNMGYGIGGFPWVSPYKALQAFPASTIPALALSSDTYAIWNEYTRAPYFRVDTTLWDRLLIVAGIRYEEHTIDAYNRLPTGAQPATPTSAAIPGRPANNRIEDKRYYPSINMKYNFTKDFDVRFGAAKSLGLPDYNQLVPSQPTVTDPTASSPTGTISIFNPSLKPYTVYNYDLTAEYYFVPSGFVSASVYHKQFNNFIVSLTQTGTQAIANQFGINTATLNAPITSYNVASTANINDGAGYYNGFELAYNQTLSFLPAPFNTVGVQANWSRLFIGGIRTNQVLSNSSSFQNAALQQDRLACSCRDDRRATTTSSTSRSTGPTRSGTPWSPSTTPAPASLSLARRHGGLHRRQSTNFYVRKTMFGSLIRRPTCGWNTPSTSAITPRTSRSLQPVQPLPQYNTVDGHVTLRSQYGDPTYELGIRGVW